MKRFAQTLLMLTLVVAIASPLAADDKKKKKKKPGKRNAAAFLFKLPKTIELTAEQKEKIGGLIKEFGPKLEEVRKKQRGIYSPEQRKARAEAIKQAKKDGKKGKEFRDAVNAAVELSAEQKQQQADVRKAFGALRQAARKARDAVLTDEQKAKLPGKKKKKKAA